MAMFGAVILAFFVAADTTPDTCEDGACQLASSLLSRKTQVSKSAVDLDGRDLGYFADYKSRPVEGSCTLYQDALPGAPLQRSSHTIVMALQFPIEATWVGCYRDDAYRMLDRGPKKRGYTGQTCSSACRWIGADYFVLQDGGWCACGRECDLENTNYTQYPKRPDAECGEAAGAYGGFRGGGKWLNALYRINETVSKPSEADYKTWEGCYVDDADRMFDRGPHDYGYTGETCASACRAIGDAYFALQNNGYCCCGSEDDLRVSLTYARGFLRPDSECGIPEEKYGGFRGGRAWRNAVYRVDPSANQPLGHQWIFNIGQIGTGAEHWLWNLHQGIDRVQFGAWNASQIGTADIYGARTMATTFDGDTGAYKLYLDGSLAAFKESVPLDINSGTMAIGGNSRQSDFQGCVRGVDVYRELLTDGEVADASENLRISVAGAPLPAPDYESRPSEHGHGTCAIYQDVLPGAPLQNSSHTIVMALQIHSQDRATSRQWILNIGQNETRAEHWLWNAHQGIDKVQFGVWNRGETFGQIRVAELSGARTMATTFDGHTGAYKLYVDGCLVAFKESVPLDIQSGHMAIGQVTKPFEGRDSDFLGCVQGVDVYRETLTADEVSDVSARLANAVG